MFSVIDVETTGFSPLNGDRIVEIGIVRMDSDGIIPGGFETLINPERGTGPAHIHGITDSMVLQAPRFSEVACDILEFIKETYIVAHNADFDMGFLKNEFARLGADFSFPVFCTLKMARAILPNLPSRSLGYLSSYFNIVNRMHHSAFGDALAAAELLRIFIQRYEYRIDFGNMKTVENVLMDIDGNSSTGKKLTRADTGQQDLFR